MLQIIGKDLRSVSLGAFGLITLGYLGYYPIQWAINRSARTDKIHHAPRPVDDRPDSSKPVLAEHYWWTAIHQNEEYQNFKRNWKQLATGKEAREREILSLKMSYENAEIHTEYTGRMGLTCQPNCDAPLGHVLHTPGEFSMWMPGVALVAAYLTEKKKINGFFVCENLEALTSQLKKIAFNDSNQRCAFVVGCNHPGVQPNVPQHKMTVCVEKKEGKLTIALLDAESDVMDDFVVEEGKLATFPCDAETNLLYTPLVYNAILKACRSAKCEARLLYAEVERENTYGCVVFALQDGIAFLRHPNFFDQISYSGKSYPIDHQYSIEIIDQLLPEQMIGTQSTRDLIAYKQVVGQSVFDSQIPGRKRTLQGYLNEHLMMTETGKGEKLQNHYVLKKHFQYLKFLEMSFKKLKLEEIRHIVSRILIRHLAS